MPWHVEVGGGTCSRDEYAVIKDADGSTAGCHATRDEADRQVRALYANEPDAERAQMTAAAINDLPDSAFAYIEPGGTKDEQGKTVPRSLRHFPIHDADHVRAALSRAPQSPFGAKAMPKIRAAAKKFGIGQPAEEGRSEQPFLVPQVFIRSYPLEDIRILTRAQGSEYADGHTVEAYAAVFDREAEIYDNDGHYLESVARTAFDKAISDSRPQGSRTVWRTGVFYNHGMTLYGTPSDRFSVPLGAPQDIKVTDHGLLTVTRYAETPLAEEILEMIRSGAITGHSFTGRIIKSDPQRSRHARPYQRRADGSFQSVRRLELGLKEYGPTPFPAYTDTAVVGMRSMLALSNLLSTTPVFDAVHSDIEGEEPAGSDTPPDEGAVTDEPPTEDVEHSSRDQDLARIAIKQRIALARRTRPGLARQGEPE